jgi:cytochrome o ubiquinol oxidase subunit 3
MSAALKTINQPQDTSKVTLGFWLYIMTDCVLFATLFATYAVLRNNTAGGPSGTDLFDINFVLIETILLLTSSFISGLALLAARKGAKKAVIVCLTLTALLGAAFLAMELSEFSHLAAEGNSWQRSAFLSSFFTLVGTHGLHITVGLLWVIVLIVKLLRSKLDAPSMRRLSLFGIFWHFLDVIWIFIFSMVYMLGAL